MKYKRLLTKINKLDYSSFSDEELKNEFLSKKNSKCNSKELAIRIAISKEIIKRTTNLVLFDVQILGAIFLLKGNVVEMKTGEGKTVVATLTALLRYLEGGKTHVITVNDYLAERDGLFSKQVFDFVGLKAEYIVSSELSGRKEKYDNSDVLYITNSELGFDYLRSNGAYKEEDIVFNIKNVLAIIDEADSVLIDEAKIPLILSASKQLKSNDYKNANTFVKTIKNTPSYYEIDLKDRQVFLTADGAKKAEKFFNLKESYTADVNSQLRHLVEQALVAHLIMIKDKDYIVVHNEVKLVDQSTGRIAEGRRFNRGLHQAIEAKENTPIKPETAIIATITYQNLFKMYDKISGMTGTAYTERKELKEIYHLKVIKIPTNKPVIRKDKKDLLFAGNKDRDIYLINMIKKEHEVGRPILIGTKSIEASEYIEKLLNKNGIHPQVLNAKNHEKEAEIIAKAGEKYAITVATNMAGRGTDIKLGEGVKELGGLLLIGIGHYDNVRIDNQLRGRAGRQGDPGESIFLVSMDDDLVNIFANDALKNLIRSLNKDNNGNPIENNSFSKAITNAQHQIQVKTFNQRKSSIDYDEILGKYRDLYYAERMKILLTDNLEELIEKITGVEGNIKIPTEVLAQIKLAILLRMDSCWMNFLTVSEDLKNESGYASYAGTKAIVTYEEKLGEYYQELLFNIRKKIKEMFVVNEK